MSQHTKIPYVDSTCNIVMGCSPPGCEVGPGCFARQLCQRFAGRKGYPKDFSKPELFLHRLADLRKWPDLTGKKREAVLAPEDGWWVDHLKHRPVVIPAKPHLDGLPRLVFLSDLGEIFDEAFRQPVLLEDTTKWNLPWLRDQRYYWPVLNVLRDCPHILIILTKQAHRMEDFFAEYPCPPNLWLGVSVTDQSTLWRVDELLKINCKVRIISHEPAWGPIDYGDRLKGIQWLVSGGQSSRYATACDLAWLDFDRDQAKASSTAWFMKQWGAKPLTAGCCLTLKHPSGADPAEWPADLQNCREVPHVGA